MARGAYLKDLGNTPGHVNHWSKRSFVRAALAPRRRRRGSLAVPVDDAARAGVSSAATAERAPSRGYGAGARILSIGIATTGVVTFAYFSLASHALSDTDYSHISLLWAVLFVIVSVIYRPIEQLLSRTIAGRRARGIEHGHPLRTPMVIQAAFAVDLRGRGPGAEGADHRRAVRRLGRAVLGPVLRGPVLRRELLRPRLAGGPPVVRPLRRPRVHGGDLALPVRARGRPRTRRGADRGRARHGRGAARLARRGSAGVLAPAARTGPAAGRRRGPRPRARRALRAGRLLRDAGRADADQRRGADGVRDRRDHGGRRLRVQRAADRPRAAAALPGDPGLAAAAPHRPARDGGRRRVPPRDPGHDPGDRGLRGRGRARPAASSGRGR